MAHREPNPTDTRTDTENAFKAWELSLTGPLFHVVWSVADYGECRGSKLGSIPCQLIEQLLHARKCS